MKLVLFSRNCGATVGPNTQATLLGKEEPLQNKSGNVFIIDQGNAQVSWKQDGKLLIALDKTARTFKKETLVRGVSIEYLPTP